MEIIPEIMKYMAYVFSLLAGWLFALFFASLAIGWSIKKTIIFLFGALFSASEAGHLVVSAPVNTVTCYSIFFGGIVIFWLSYLSYKSDEGLVGRDD